MKVSISICPTTLEFANGDFYDADKLLAAIRRHIEERYPKAKITCLQVGHRQGDEWSRVDGDDDAGEELMDTFWSENVTDSRLFVNP